MIEYIRMIIVDHCEENNWNYETITSISELENNLYYVEFDYDKFGIPESSVLTVGL